MATSPPVSGDAVRVRDGQRARPVRADPYCFNSVRLGTHDGYRDEFWRRRVAHSSLFEAYSLPHAACRSDFAGRDLTEHLMKSLVPLPCESALSPTPLSARSEFVLHCA